MKNRGAKHRQYEGILDLAVRVFAQGLSRTVWGARRYAAP